MVYSKTTWQEGKMTTSQKISALNNLETQYDEAVNLINTHNHDSLYYTKSQMNSKYFKSDNDGAGSGFVAKTLDGYTADQIIAAAVPSGCIAIWSGSVSSIPSGWRLCDGNNGTPDLRNRFVVGVGSTFTPKGSVGGYAERTPSVTSASINEIALTVDQLPSHTHSIPTDKYNNATTGASSGYSGASGNPTEHSRYTEYTGGGGTHGHSVTVSCNPYNNLPAYYKLAFIMKV